MVKRNRHWMMDAASALGIRGAIINYSACNVSLVDGLIWSQEAASSNLATQTNTGAMG